MAATADTAVGVMVAITPASRQAKAVHSALRNQGRVIDIDPRDIGFLNRGNDERLAPAAWGGPDGAAPRFAPSGAILTLRRYANASQTTHHPQKQQEPA